MKKLFLNPRPTASRFFGLPKVPATNVFVRNCLLNLPTAIRVHFLSLWKLILSP